MNVAPVLFAAGAAILAAAPVRWLAHTWTDPAYDSPGPWVFALAVALFAWSWSSARAGEASAGGRTAQRLLAATALIRVVSHLLDVDVLGGLALVVDVYALALLCHLPTRRRALSAGWLALVFAFCLPVERVLQRLVGYGLQWTSAAAASRLLALAVSDLEWAGVSIRVGGRYVLVDVPCSGARGLVTLGLLFATACALGRPTWRHAAFGISVALAGAAAANVLRVAALAIGVAFPESIGIDVMAAPWHEAIGAAALATGALPIVWWARRIPPRVAVKTPDDVERVPASSNGHRMVFASLFLCLALALHAMPHRPVDASAPVEPAALPATLLGHPRDLQPLEEKERVYFTRYGGKAVKARYGPFAVLAVTTTAPLRHLHAPDECLRGAGHSVRLIRTAYDGRLPSALYASRTPDGESFRVAATFVSNRGDVATSVSEVAWRWLNASDTVWTGIERIFPADLPLDAAAEFDAALAAALELPAAASTHNPPSPNDGKRRIEG